ncbi:MAG TPA: YggT family protein [Acholeplasmataceae bacterium]|nr:YggT family protein [Acholeplasmataceae bacterium]
MIYFLTFLYYILQVYFLFIVINIFITWIPVLYEYKFFRVCRNISDWYLGPFRGVLVFGPFDFTPILGLILYQTILSFLYNL